MNPVHDNAVYFSANDAVLEWAVAFLNSFRTFNADLPLFWIPFGEDTARIKKLADAYRFTPFVDPSFGELEAIGAKLELGHTPHGRYWFRRYAAFWGPAERFCYLDARQVVLRDLSEPIQALDQHDFDLMHFDQDLEQVYQSGPIRQDFLRRGGANGFNSGRWCARRGLFNLEQFVEAGERMHRDREQFNPRNTDQAFINYCVDSNPALRVAHVADAIGDTCRVNWARQPGRPYRDTDGFRLWDHGGADHRRRLFLMHWAGIPLSTAMPKRTLFRCFRDRDRSLAQRAGSVLSDTVRWPALYTIQRLRRNRALNQLLKRMRNSS